MGAARYVRDVGLARGATGSGSIVADQNEGGMGASVMPRQAIRA